MDGSYFPIYSDGLFLLVWLDPQLKMIIDIAELMPAMYPSLDLVETSHLDYLSNLEYTAVGLCLSPDVVRGSLSDHLCSLHE